MSNYSDFYGQYTYRDPLLFYKIENLDWWMHRDWSVRRDPFLKKFINGLDIAIFQEKPIFIPDILESDTEVESPEDSDTPVEKEVSEIDENKLTLWNDDDKDILLDWNKENWDDFMVKMYDSARTHKWCIVVLYDEAPYWYVFTYREIMEIEYDENDNPIRAHAMWSKVTPLPTTFRQHDIWINLLEKDTDKLNEDGDNTGMGLFVNWGHDIDENVDGNDLESVWAAIVYLRHILFDILCNSARSSGFFWAKLGGGDTKDTEAKLMDAFENASASHIFAASKTLVEELKAMYAANPEFSIEAMDKVMKIFSGATGLPYLFFNSVDDESGWFKENSSEMRQINNKKREVFSQLKFYILKLVEMRWGIVCDDVFPNIPEPEIKDQSFDDDIIDKRTPGSIGIEKELRRTRLRK
ncbi:hypothetical protein LCGC14_0910910 [marine sediment metagenome]|uniref:Uncharacterized protein n=1 Tax=marine sediment metagenome TaxID=412755 RepID=A0A0F9RCM4_9ZZZZ